MNWTVTISRQASKQINRLPSKTKERLIALIRDIENQGPARGNWPNYGLLSDGRHHCHIKKGNPTYVAVGEVKKKSDLLR